MPVHNAEIARALNDYADLLEISGANQFRVRAYRTAARNISELPHSISEMVKQGEPLSSIPGLGKELTAKVEEMATSGSFSQLEEFKKEFPAGLLDITRVGGLGPRRTRALYQELGITDIEQLARAAKEKRIRELPGFAARTEQKILDEIGRRESTAEENRRYRLAVAMEIVQPLLQYLDDIRGIKNIKVAGSYRRKRETVGDLDILVTHKKGADVIKRFVEYEDVDRVVSQGETRSTVVLRPGIQVDLRVVPEASYGAALHYFTGSQAHNIAVRKLGVEKGLKINEYGVFKGSRKVTGNTEEEVYKQVELPYIEPELREGSGEIEAAKQGRLPDLVSLEDIRGDLHSHTRATDGRSTLEEMARAARGKGYQYLAVTDHSRHVTVARGLDAERLAEQIDDIDRLNEKMKSFTLLKGIELDILDDGSLDLPGDILKRLDLVVCAVHYRFDLPEEKQTERIIRGIDNPYFTILAHPTGRMIGERDPYQVDMERVMKAARETGTVMEINAQPSRLDLNDTHARMAREMGVMVAISTDAHSTRDLELMGFGINQARRGWLEADNVLNTRSWKDLQKMLGR